MKNSHFKMELIILAQIFNNIILMMFKYNLKIIHRISKQDKKRHLEYLKKIY